MENNYFLNRSSVREYSTQNISQELLEEILEQAMRAPTCGNMQLYSVIVTRDEDLKRNLEQYHFNQPAAVSSNVILTICADFNLFTRWCEINKAKPGYNNFHSFIMAMTDAIIFAQQIVTIAENSGLGSCYLGTVNYNAKEISQLLELPDLVVPVAAISLGYPLTKPQPVDRLPLKAIMHQEKYRKDTDEKIQEFFNYKESLEENKAFVAENNKESLAQVFTDIRYPKKLNEEVSQSFKNLIKEKGFE